MIILREVIDNMNFPLEGLSMNDEKNKQWIVLLYSGTGRYYAAVGPYDSEQEARTRAATGHRAGMNEVLPLYLPDQPKENKS